MDWMGRLVRRHSALVTATLLGALLLNLLVVGYVAPADDALTDDLPLAAQCQGGGPGCVEQPLIPPPAVGLPRFDAPPAPVFGIATVVEPPRLAAIHDADPADIAHPPAAHMAA